MEGRSKVIYLQESFIPQLSSFARWRGKVPRPITAVTVCYRLKIFYYRPIVTVFSYIDEKGRKFQTGGDGGGGRERSKEGQTWTADRHSNIPRIQDLFHIVLKYSCNTQIIKHLHAAVHLPLKGPSQSTHINAFCIISSRK